MPRPARRSAERSAAATVSAVSWLAIRGAAHNNLKNLDVPFPLARFVCVTGVSGSGKSSLVNDILYEALARDLNGAETAPGKHTRIDGLDHLDKIIAIDQTPIGRTPRSNPATYIKLFDEIRDLFAGLPDSKVRGYKKGRFSFNVKHDAEAGPLASAASAGRCAACEGNGSNRIEMDFLADVWVTCPVCNGQRFNAETLAIHFKGKSIADVLGMDVQQALAHFENVPKIATMLRTLHDVGLDYLKLGQASTTLSGGEAQRIKLARELVKPATGRTLYVLDEPTTGLHFEDIRRLLDVLHGFVDAGNSVVVIEHNLDVIKTADWIIDLGPEGGDAGGYIVATGTPEQVAAVKASSTGQALRDVLPGLARGRAAAANRSALASKPAGSRATFRAPAEVIRVRGAREHNLQDVACDIPRGRMTVCTGVSGSGKTSLALDTIYVEGQRRYLESLSSYARQFLGQFAKPRVEQIDGLSPAIAIEQKSASRTPRSTVGTVTEIYDYMRVLWARLAQPICPDCNEPIGAHSADEIIAAVLAMPAGTRVLLAAPVERAAGESGDALFARLRSSGYARIRVDGVVHELDRPPDLPPSGCPAIDVVIDRLIVNPRDRARVADSVEHGLAAGGGVVWLIPADGPSPGLAAPRRFSRHHACRSCGRIYEELTPHHFSFNNRLGWCPTCEGLGVQNGTSESVVVRHPERSLLDGAIAGWERLADRPGLRALVSAVADHAGFDAAAPWNALTDAQRRAVLFGTGDAWLTVEPANGSTRSRRAPRPAAQTVHPARVQFKGFFPAIDEATRISWQYRVHFSELVTQIDCQVCKAARLARAPAAARLAGKTIVEVCTLPLSEALRFFEGYDRKLSRPQRAVAGELLHEIVNRLRFLVDVGLDYLTLHRAAPTLSGGEAQRIQLASQIGSGLTGVLYVLDEPTIGLHPRDNHRLIAALQRLRDLGNTLLLVEHDRDVIGAADRLIDFGPGAGRLGGRIVATGTAKNLRAATESLTGAYLDQRESMPVPNDRRPVGEAAPRRGRATAGDAAAPPQPVEWLTIVNARHNNLRNIDVAIPLGRLVAVTGVSGSGKSSLVADVLHAALARRLHGARVSPGAHDEIRGLDRIDKVINVDQSPIGNSPLSSPATYTGVFDLIRDLFVRLPTSRVRGFSANRFSFNRPGGRCEVCEGLGQVRHEMHFLPDVWVECETCRGQRYNAETLEVKFRNHSIAEVLALTVDRALALFENVPRVLRPLQTLADVGLGYIALGQPANTLSGGEAQRVKLASELGKPSTGQTLYLLDEPTTGLHFADVRRLLIVLQRLVELGNTALCVEHNLDVIKSADWVIDLGPEAGAAGGTVVVAGTPEAVAACGASHTGRALKPILARDPRGPRLPPAESAAPPPTSAEPPAAAANAAVAAPAAGVAVADLPAADAEMPWRRNGRAWHLRDRVSRRGEKIEWEPAALEFVIEQIERLGGDALAPTDWNDRACIEIRARPGQGGRRQRAVVLPRARPAAAGCST
ncbi:MAG: excinuclease ABC subunit UvrA [Phycisphaerae bacterium]